MLNSLIWRKLRGSEIANQIESLREDTLRLILGIVSIGYLVWHIAVTIFLPAANELPYRSLFPVVVIGLAISYLILKTRPSLAVWSFLGTSIVSITAALWLLADPAALILYPVVALAGIVLVNPLAGLAAGAASLGLVGALYQAGPLAFLDANRIFQAGAASLLTVAVAWTLDRNLVIAIEWSLQSYDQALKSTQEARGHRAQLVEALKQLDRAYYRLERASAALETAWKAAETAERSKSEFVTNISHELRTPLNLIVGFSEMIATSPETYGTLLPTAYRADMFAIYRSAQHLLTLTTDVLDLARVGIGRLALSREPADLAEIIGGACDIVREYVAAKGLQLTVAAEPDLPLFSVDRLRIRQVLLNLLTNAARFTERGGIAVSVGRDGDAVIVKVTDTGRGIPPSELPRVFDEFSSGDRHRQNPNSLGGIGLGLPISRRLIELHGGEMGIASEEGAGTTFWIRLPASTVDGASSGASGRPLRVPHLAGGSERVLVLLGDDGGLVSFLQRHLRRCRLIAAPDITRAAEIAVESRAAAIIADLDALPADDAAALPVPVIRLPLPHGRRIASELGVVAYLTKPVSRSELASVIDELPRPVRIAVVADDDPGFARLLTLMLRSLAPEAEPTVLAAHNGREALDLLATVDPDLVLLDMVMPGMGGDEVAAAMAADPRLARVPVVVISGQDQPEWTLPLRGEIRAVRAEGFRLEELLGSVEVLLDVFDPPRGYLLERAATEPQAEPQTEPQPAVPANP
jgi:signal transduction histidine kinase/CheY-like chemotaxis protein